jgi:competence ComEA-like helix-hairpin-helix protein
MQFFQILSRLSSRIRQRLPNDRTIPILIVLTVFATLGVAFHEDRAGVAPASHSSFTGAYNLLDAKKIDLNSATVQDLTQIPRLSRRVAQAITEERKLLGRFTTFDQVDEVKGVGEKTLARLKDMTEIQSVLNPSKTHK